MAGAARTITIDDEELSAALRRIVESGENPEPVLDEIGGAMVQRTRERFEQGRGPGGTPWRPSIRARAQGGKTLIDRARLFQSLTHLVTGQAVEWGTSVIYAGVHQFGAVIKAKTAKALRFQIPGVGWIMKKSVTIPARPFIGFDETDRNVLERILADWLDRLALGGAASSPKGRAS